MLSPYRTPSKRTTVLTAPVHRAQSIQSAPAPPHGPATQGGLHTDGACGRCELVNMRDDRLLERNGHRRPTKVGLWPPKVHTSRISHGRAATTRTSIDNPPRSCALRPRRRHPFPAVRSGTAGTAAQSLSSVCDARPRLRFWQAAHFITHPRYPTPPSHPKPRTHATARRPTPPPVPTHLCCAGAATLTAGSVLQTGRMLRADAVPAAFVAGGPRTRTAVQRTKTVG